MQTLISLILCSACLSAGAVKIVCYYRSWAVYRQDKGEFNVVDIDASLCTHFIYSFVTFDGEKVISSHPRVDLPNDGGKDGYRLFTELRKKNPSAKVLFAIGGGSHSNGPKYSNMASSPKARKQFIDGIVKHIKQHNFDGCDIDWEYPTQNGGKAVDRENYVLLLKELRERFDHEGDLLLTAAVAASEWTASRAYNISEMMKYLDFVNLMAYDFYFLQSKITGHHAALRGTRSVEASVTYWLNQGCPKEKLIVGIPTYGIAWTLATSSNYHVGALVSGLGTAGQYTKEPGVLGYNEICELITTEGWSVHFDNQSRSQFATKDRQWVSYDSVTSVTEKAQFIQKFELGGAMVWAIDTDDFKGTCGEKFPILKTLNCTLRNNNSMSNQ